MPTAITAGLRCGRPVARAMHGRICAPVCGAAGFPILGRVTMDLTMFDVTDLPAMSGQRRLGRLRRIVRRTTLARLTTLAAAAGTIGYEILTALGRRYRRSI